MNEIYQIPDSMYDLALAFKKEKLWNQLMDNELFAVRHSDGTISYCSVMGYLGEHFAIGVYHGAEELDTLRRIPVDEYVADEHERVEWQLSQNCLMLSFESKEEVYPVIYKEIREYCKRSGTVLRGANAFPLYEKIQPCHMPWYVTDETDAMYLRESVEAAMAVSEALKQKTKKELGFINHAAEGKKIPMWSKDGDQYIIEKTELPPETDVVYPIGVLENDVMEAQLKKVKKNRRTWAIHVFIAMNEVLSQDAPKKNEKTAVNPSFFPFIMLIIDEKDGTILANAISEYDGDVCETFISAFCNTIMNYGRPSRIHVIHPRTESLLAEIGKKLDIPVECETENAFIQDAIEQMDVFLSDDRDEDAVLEELRSMLDVIKDPLILRQIPDCDLEELLQLQEYGVLTPEITKLLMAERKRRNR